MIHVLIAEDDPDCRKTLEQIITLRGYQVHTATDGLIAVEVLFSNREITVVISDYAMGGGQKDGDAFYEMIREELERRNGIFIVSSAIISEEKRKYFEANGVQVIEKFHLYNKDKLRDAFARIEAPRA